MDSQVHFSVLLKPFLSAGDKANIGYKLPQHLYMDVSLGEIKRLEQHSVSHIPKLIGIKPASVHHCRKTGETNVSQLH